MAGPFTQTTALLFLGHWARKHRVGAAAERDRLDDLLTQAATAAFREERASLDAASALETAAAQRRLDAEAARAKAGEAERHADRKIESMRATLDRERDELLAALSAEHEKAKVRDRRLDESARALDEVRARSEKSLGLVRSRFDAATATAAAALAERDAASRRLVAARNAADEARDRAATYREDLRAAQREVASLTRKREITVDINALRDEVRIEKERREYFELLALEERKRRQTAVRRCRGVVAAVGDVTKRLATTRRRETLATATREVQALAAELADLEQWPNLVEASARDNKRRRPAEEAKDDLAREEQRWRAIEKGVGAMLAPPVATRRRPTESADELAEACATREGVRAALAELEALDIDAGAKKPTRLASTRTRHARRRAIAQVALASSSAQQVRKGNVDDLRSAIAVLGVETLDDRLFPDAVLAGQILPLSAAADGAVIAGMEATERDAAEQRQQTTLLQDSERGDNSSTTNGTSMGLLASVVTRDDEAKQPAKTLDDRLLLDMSGTGKTLPLSDGVAPVGMEPIVGQQRQTTVSLDGDRGDDDGASSSSKEAVVVVCAKRNDEPCVKVLDGAGRNLPCSDGSVATTVTEVTTEQQRQNNTPQLPDSERGDDVSAGNDRSKGSLEAAGNRAKQRDQATTTTTTVDIEELSQSDRLLVADVLPQPRKYDTAGRNRNESPLAAAARADSIASTGEGMSKPLRAATQVQPLPQHVLRDHLQQQQQLQQGQQRAATKKRYEARAQSLRSKLVAVTSYLRADARALAELVKRSKDADDRAAAALTVLTATKARVAASQDELRRVRERTLRRFISLCVRRRREKVWRHWCLAARIPFRVAGGALLGAALRAAIRRARVSSARRAVHRWWRMISCEATPGSPPPFDESDDEDESHEAGVSSTCSSVPPPPPPCTTTRDGASSPLASRMVRHSATSPLAPPEVLHVRESATAMSPPPPKVLLRDSATWTSPSRLRDSATWVSPSSKQRRRAEDEAELVADHLESIDAEIAKLDLGPAATQLRRRLRRVASLAAAAKGGRDQELEALAAQNGALATALRATPRDATVASAEIRVLEARLEALADQVERERAAHRAEVSRHKSEIQNASEVFAVERAELTARLREEAATIHDLTERCDELQARLARPVIGKNNARAADAFLGSRDAAETVDFYARRRNHYQGGPPIVTPTDVAPPRRRRVAQCDVSLSTDDDDATPPEASFGGDVKERAAVSELLHANDTLMRALGLKRRDY